MPRSAAESRGRVPFRGPGEDGFSLIELLVTLVIVGSAFVILVGGTLTGVIASNTHREKADGEIVLRRFVEEVQFDASTPCPLATSPVPREFDGDWDDNYKLEIEACQDLIRDESNAPVLRRFRLAVEPIVGGGSGPARNSRLEIEVVRRKDL